MAVLVEEGPDNQQDKPDEGRLWRQAIGLAQVAHVSPRHIGMVNRYASHHLAYHNAIHCLETGIRAYMEAMRLDLDPAQQLLAGWYHDLGHTGDPDAGDHVNVALAVAIWERHGIPEESRFAAWHGNGHNQGWLIDVTRLIRATQWPHGRARHIDEQVIRNADLAQTLDRPDWLARLAQETGHIHDPNFAKHHMTLIR